MILCVDAASYLDKQAEDDFERTLEVVGSLALRLEREGQSVGLATDAPTEEGGPTILAPAMGPVQVSSILETLARLRFETSGDLAARVHWRRPIPWGTSCLLFCCETGEGVARIKAYLDRRRVYTVLVACRVSGTGRGMSGTPMPLKISMARRVKACESQWKNLSSFCGGLHGFLLALCLGAIYDLFPDPRTFPLA